MFKNKFQEAIYALITIFITVNVFVLYTVYVLEGKTLKEVTGAHSVIEAINMMGGVYMFGHYLPIWAVILIEIGVAFALDMLIGGPLAMKIAFTVCNPKDVHPLFMEAVIICCTAAIMCPMMSCLAAAFYYPYYEGFHVLTLLAEMFKTLCRNFPVAFLGQLFFIQPLTRTIFFKLLFRRPKQSQTN